MSRRRSLVFVSKPVHTIQLTTLGLTLLVLLAAAFETIAFALLLVATVLASSLLGLTRSSGLGASSHTDSPP